MNRTLRWCAAMLGVALAAGCGGGKVGSDAPAAKSPYDVGARAGESPYANVFAVKGEELFKAKACTACHAFGHRLTCPDLKGVTMRRTDEWLLHQILRPDVMTKEDPIAKDLFATYMAQMPNQGLTQEEAMMVIHFLRKIDHYMGVTP